jgi:hypothetical protein
MARQIIKQPNGKFCIFSSVCDNVTYYDMEEQEIIDVWARESKKDIEEQVKKIISDLNKGDKPYRYETMTYEEMLEKVKNIHGEEASETIKKEIED